jgi:hypothetical protein
VTARSEAGIVFPFDTRTVPRRGLVKIVVTEGDRQGPAMVSADGRG